MTKSLDRKAMPSNKADDGFFCSGFMVFPCSAGRQADGYTWWTLDRKDEENNIWKSLLMPSFASYGSSGLTQLFDVNAINRMN